MEVGNPTSNRRVLLFQVHVQLLGQWRMERGSYQAESQQVQCRPKRQRQTAVLSSGPGSFTLTLDGPTFRRAGLPTKLFCSGQ